MKFVQFKRAYLAGGLACLVAGAFFGGRVWAMGVPATSALTYSGSLEDAAGVPLTGSHNLQISFWGAATGGTAPLCQTASSPVTLEPQGRFSVTLPDTCANAVHGSPNVWAEVTADGLPLGRTKLGAVPYALEAGSAVQATQGATRLSGATQQAARVCAGATPVGSTNWAQYGTDGITTTIDIGACGFKAAPVLTTSLGGTTQHWTSTGGSEPYSISATSFIIFIRSADVTPANANERNWHVNWIAVGN